MKKYKGNPILTVRMPRHIISALQILALRKNLTISDILRELVESELRREGLPVAEQPLEGQVRMDV